MKEYNRALSAILCSTTMLLGSSSLLAQEKQQESNTKQRTRVVEVTGGPAVKQFTHATDPLHFIRVDHDQGSDNTFVFVSGEMSFDGKVVKGAPYSAQAVNESVQMLADGNRIVHRNTASVYRDGEGRTRREQAFKIIGSYTTATEPPQAVFINDPVAGVNYTLNARDRTAFKMPRIAKDVTWTESSGDRVVERRESFETTVQVAPRARVGAARGGEVFVGPPHRAPGSMIAYGGSSLSAKPKTEALGKQMIEGVEAEGTRTTITIAAGEIGNERPIEIVSERWYSPELQTLIMSRHSDPRTGESTYRLTGITRDEPARSLFEIPADYKIEEHSPNIRVRVPRNEQ
jgi:hypothetical protein